MSPKGGLLNLISTSTNLIGLSFNEMKLKLYLINLLVTVSLVSLLFLNACGHRGPLNLPEERSYPEGAVYERY